jgi:putative transposase
MVRFRRNLVPGGTYFFTLTLRDRRSNTLTDHVDLLRAAFRAARKRRPFEIVAIAILPEHLHTVMTLPEGDSDYATRWRAIKGGFSRALSRAGVPLEKDSRGEYRLWQRRFWEHTIRDEQDLANHVDYVHYNPVKHGLVSRVSDWPWSSFHRFVRVGWANPDWAAEPVDFGAAEFGEPRGADRDE